jgi:RimJ/RimL family protein N-acetyltransferase
MVLKGKKVILRPIRLSDAPRFVKWLNDTGITKFLQRRKRLTLKQEKKWISEALRSKSQKSFIIETSSGVCVGCTGLALNLDHHRATFGIFIGEKNYWNQGLGSEAARLVLGYGFGKLKLHRIELGVLEYNPRAMKVYKRLGFKKEGVRRDHILYSGKYYDDIHMGLLKQEWEKLNKKKLLTK